MSEIVCQSCGARNPTQSKYCNKCGAELRSGTSQICPNCEKSNPIELLYCDHCGTLLADDALPETGDEETDEGQAADSRSKPFSLPSRAPGQTGDLDVSGEIPGWLKTGDVAEGNESDDEPEWLQAAQSEEGWEDSDAPTLDELSGSHAPSDDLPTWLLEDEAADAIFNSEKDTNELFNSSQPQPQDEDDVENDSSAEEELPDWLEGLSPPGTGPLPFVENEEGEQETEPEPENETSAGDGEAQGDAALELQSWLNDIEDDEPAAPDSGDLEPSVAEEPGTGDEPEPASDWSEGLSTGDEVTENIEAANEPEEDFARWLTGEPLETDRPKTDPPDVQSMDDEDFLQWLADTQDEEPGPASAETPGEEEQEFTVPEESQQASELVTGDETPSWLDRPDDESPVEDKMPPSADDESEAAPDWLAELDEGGFEAFADPMPDDESAEEGPSWSRSSEASTSEDGEEDWFEGLAEGESGGEDDSEMTEEDFMAWLDSLDEGAEEAVGDEEEEDVPEVEAYEGLSMELDDWAGGEKEELPAELFGGPVPDEGAIEAPEEPPVEMPAELPAWLGELAESDEEAVDSGDELSGEVPDWLQSLPSSGEAGPLPYLEADEVEEQEQVIEDSTPEPEAEAEVEAGVEQDDDLPEWLAGVSPELDLGAQPEAKADQPQSPAQAPQPEQPEEPDDAGAQAERQVAPSELDFAEASLNPEARDDLVPTQDLPDWFSDVMADIEAENALDSDSSAPDELSNVPSQLAANELPEWLDSPFADTAEAQPTPLDEIPEWLQPPEAGDEASAAELEELLELGTDESSDEWTDLLEALPPPERDEERLSEADIPEWLKALKPQALRGDDEETPSMEPEESEGPLAGLRGVIGVAPAMSQPRLAERTDPDVLAHEHEQQVALLRQLARSESQAMSPATMPAAPQPLAPAIRLLLSVLLLVTLLAGLLLSETIAPFAAAFTAPGPASEAATLIDQAVDAPVIVAFEYTPALSGALSADAVGVLTRLAENESTAVLVSQSAAGAALARQAAAAVPGLQSEFLGYIPGGAAGLRSLSTCVADVQPCDSLFGHALDEASRLALNEAALAIVLTGERDQLINWVEQVQATTDIAMMAFVTEALAPVAAPYDSSGQLATVTSGTSSALATDQSLSEQETAVMLGRWLAAGAILIGAIYYLVTGTSKKGRSKIDE